MIGTPITSNPAPIRVIGNFTQLLIDSHVRGVLSDLDNTFYQYEPCHQQGLLAAQGSLEKVRGPLPDFLNRYESAKQEVKKKVGRQAASHSRLLYFQTFLESLSDKRDLINLTLSMEAAYWDAFIAHMKPVAGLHDFLAACKENHIKTVIISDMTTSIQFRKIIALGIANQIDFVVTSEEAGTEKPDPKIFQLALKKAGLTAEESIVIGDDLARDGAGAKLAGMPWLQIIHA